MTTKGAARNHHFVPQFYLRGFAKPRSKDGKLQVFDMERRRRFETNPRNVGSRRDFNRIDVDGVDPNTVESRLSTIETDLDKSFKAIIKAKSISSADDLGSVLVLIARMFLATPQFRRQRDRFMSGVTQKMMNQMVASRERWETVTAQAKADGVIENPVDYEDMRAAVAEGRIVPHTNKEILIQQEFELWMRIVHTLEGRNWTLYVSDAATGEFATSDHPCTLRWTEAALDHGFHGPGLGLAKTTVIFPVSRHLALEGRFESGGGELKVDRQLVAAINVATLGSADHQLYASGDFPILDIDREVRPFSTSQLWEQIRNRPCETVGRTGPNDED